MKPTKPPTLEDVARAASVSTATISRAINDPNKVAKETRLKIQTAIETLGYTPNFGGRALASNRTNTVGVLIPSLSNAMFASGVQAFEEALSESGVTLLIASTRYDPDQELRQIRSLMAHGADGLLLIGSERPAKTWDFLALRQVPFVVSWAFNTDDGRIYAGFDNFKAAAQITQAGLDAGHRRIGMIAGITQNNDRAYQRVAGVRATIAGTPDAKLLCVVEAPYLLQHGSDAFDEIFAQGPLPSLIICGNDVLAAGAILAARAKGLRVPQDISITGFDDIGIAAVSEPALTTVRIPQAEMGRMAAKLLLERLNGADAQQSVEFATDVIFRGTLAPPSAFPSA